MAMGVEQELFSCGEVFFFFILSLWDEVNRDRGSLLYYA
jgi:hypothetical protein